MHAFACQRALAVVVLHGGIREKVLAQSILTTAGAHASPKRRYGVIFLACPHGVDILHAPTGPSPLLLQVGRVRSRDEHWSDSSRRSPCPRRDICRSSSARGRSTTHFSDFGLARLSGRTSIDSNRRVGAQGIVEIQTRRLSNSH